MAALLQYLMITLLYSTNAKLDICYVAITVSVVCDIPVNSYSNTYNTAVSLDYSTS